MYRLSYYKTSNYTISMLKIIDLPTIKSILPKADLINEIQFLYEKILKISKKIRKSFLKIFKIY